MGRIKKFGSRKKNKRAQTAKARWQRQKAEEKETCTKELNDLPYAIPLEMSLTKDDSQNTRCILDEVLKATRNMLLTVEQNSNLHPQHTIFELVLSACLSQGNMPQGVTVTNNISTELDSDPLAIIKVENGGFQVNTSNWEEKRSGDSRVVCTKVVFSRSSLSETQNLGSSMNYNHEGTNSLAESGGTKTRGTAKPKPQKEKPFMNCAADFAAADGRKASPKAKKRAQNSDFKLKPAKRSRAARLPVSHQVQRMMSKLRNESNEMIDQSSLASGKLPKRRLQHKIDYNLKENECEQCGKIFKSAQILSCHMKRNICQADPEAAKEISCERCGKLFKTAGGLSCHTKLNACLPGSYLCSQCGEEFETRAKLRSHRKRHAPRNTKCTLCDFVARGPDRLKLHMCTAHQYPKPHICEHCGKSFLHAYILNNHVQFYHLGIHPFVCSICDKGCPSYQMFYFHMQTHDEVEKGTGKANSILQYAKKVT